MTTDSAAPEPIAIVGMACRFPGAPDVDAFWRNLRDGVESVRRFSDDELRAAGVEPALFRQPAYVAAHGAIDDADCFDEAFFGMSPREAEILDPQHRVFLECAWSAIEHAGHDPETVGERFGVVAGVGLNAYLLHNLMPRRDLVTPERLYALFVANDKDFLPTRVSYKLNLRGPSLNVNTACSSSLVAVHVAAQMLWSYQCDGALAGGVALQVPQHAGYLHQPGGIASPDGRCRAFDAAADGTVTGSGAGVVMLKRLSDAEADGDTIYALIRGTAVNNDGAVKAGYTAPSAAGQAAVIAEAAALACVAPESIGYVEAHGTGTPLGDPIEIAALTEAFGPDARRGACKIGSAKTNIGHLDAAAGIAGLLKTTLALRNEAIPASLHFTAPNPKIDFAASPFSVCAELTAWPRTDAPRRAGVSSFGIGGTNAHAVLEESPAEPARPQRGVPRLFVVSARTRGALGRAIARLAAHLETASARPDDVAWTLATGRTAFRYAAFAVASSCAELARGLRAGTYVEGERPASPAGIAPATDDLAALGGAWLAGATIDVDALFAHDAPRRIALPTYPFERSRHWIDPCADAGATTAGVAAPAHDLADWFSVPVWAQAAPLLPAPASALAGECLAFVRETALDRALVAALDRAGARVTAVPAGTTDYDALLAALAERGAFPERVVHAWTLGARSAGEVQTDGFDALLALMRAVARAGRTVREVAVVTSDLADVQGCERLDARKSILLGPVAVIPEEFPGTACRLVDVDAGADVTRTAADLARELGHPAQARFTALRAGRRWLPHFVPLALPAPPAGAQPFKDGGTYLITGGLGGLGLALAEHLATTARAALVLTGRRSLPPEETWTARARAAEGAIGTPLPELAAEVTRAEREITDELSIAAVDDRPGLREAADTLAGGCALAYLAQLGVLRTAGERVPRARIYAAGAVLPQFRRLVDHLLDLLARRGWLELDADDVTLLRDPGSATPVAELRAVATRTFPGFAPLFGLLEACAQSYPESLSGKIPAIGVLFPDGGRGRIVEAAEQMEEHGNHRVYRTLLAEVLRRLATRATRRRPLRILEVGGGNAIMTGLIAERLQGLDVEYTFTDIGRSFVLAAEANARTRGYDFMTFATFDISRDPGPQGFPPGSFDAVIGLDVVHATPSIRETIGNLRGLIAEGGLLGLVESARTHAWDDMIWGLAEGWWYYTDPELRNPNAPLLATARWETALEPCGFTAVRAFPLDPAARTRTDCSLILAQAGVATAQAAVPADAETLAALVRIRERAKSLVVRQVDVADEAGMERVVAEAEQRFGRVDGVVHAAAIEYKALITSRERPVEETEFRPKVVGTLVLDRIFRDRPLDFMVLCSSISGVLGGAGQVGYCAANAFLDAFAAQRSRERDELTVAIDWGRWQGVGLARDFESWHEARTGRVLSGGMTTAEGFEALCRILIYRVAPQVAVMNAAPERLAAPSAPPATPAQMAEFDGTVLEGQLAEIWRTVLGTGTFGRDATFAELGGDSLVGIQMIARIRELLGVQLPIQAIFDCPTIAELARCVEQAQAGEIEEGII